MDSGAGRTPGSQRRDWGWIYTQVHTLAAGGPANGGMTAGWVPAARGSAGRGCDKTVHPLCGGGLGRANSLVY